MKNHVKVVLQPGKAEVINNFTLSSDGIQRGSIMVESSEIQIVNGFATESRRTAFINGEIKVLAKLQLKEGSMIEGKIVVHEDVKPFYVGQEPKINPTTKVTMLHGEQPVYR